MTLRERLLTTQRGGQPDRIPWNIYDWVLPNTAAAHFLQSKGLTLMGTRKIFRKVYEGVRMTEEQSEEYTLDLLRIGVPGGRLIMGCTEEFPLGEFEKTFSAIGRAMTRYEGFSWN